MDIKNIISVLDQEWSENGLLAKLRDGQFSIADGEKFLVFLNSIDISEDLCLPKRFISLIWYLPIFLRWQSERVQEHSGNGVAFDDFITKVDNALERVLGVP